LSSNDCSAWMTWLHWQIKSGLKRVVAETRHERRCADDYFDIPDLYSSILGLNDCAVVRDRHLSRTNWLSRRIDETGSRKSLAAADTAKSMGNTPQWKLSEARIQEWSMRDRARNVQR